MSTTAGRAALERSRRRVGLAAGLAASSQDGKLNCPNSFT